MRWNMKTDNRIYILVTVLLLAAPHLGAQNLNPTVEVTNLYQAGAADIHKPQLEMAVPDSLLRFDLDFDYTVFDNPYRGAYQFRPYMTDMQPAKDAWRGRTFFLKAGAGYTLHPEASFVYSPDLPGRLQMSVYGDHRSYFGKYISVGTLSDGPTFAAGGGNYTLGDTGAAPWSGHDMSNRFGLEGRMNLGTALLQAGACYDGFSFGAQDRDRNVHSGEVTLRVTRGALSPSDFHYEAGFRGRMLQDRMSVSDAALSERFFTVDGTVGPELSSGDRVLVGFELSTYAWRRLYEDNAGHIGIAPRYELERDGLHASLGIRLNAVLPGEQAFGRRTFLLTPDVHVSYDILNKHIRLFSYLTGGCRMNTWSSLSEAAHPIFPVIQETALLPLSFFPDLQATFTKIDAGIGAAGHITPDILFSLRGGFASREGQPFFATFYQAKSGSGLYGDGVPQYCFEDCRTWYADLDASWESERFSVDGGLRLKKTDFVDLADPVAAYNLVRFEDPLLTGNLRFKYHVNSRLYAGVRLEFSTSRQGFCPEAASSTIHRVRIPGWVDPGIVGGYRLNGRLGFWLESGNLLGQTIQRVPLYAEKGPWFTAGITLTL